MGVKVGLTEVLLSDIHFPYVDWGVYKTVVKLMKIIQPDIIFLNGDIVDFYPISTFNRNPQRLNSLQEELDIAKSEIKKLRDLFPQAIMYYRMGNHEFRLQRYLWNKAPELAGLRSLDLTGRDQLDLYNMKIVNATGGEGRKAFKIGKLYHIHGDEIKAGAVYTAKTVFTRTRTNTIAGHWHRAQYYLDRDMQGNDRGSWLNPCLCKMSVEYDVFPNWQHGFSVIHYTQQGHFHVEQVVFSNRRILFNGKEYIAGR